MYEHMFIAEYRCYLHSNLEVLICTQQELEYDGRRLLAEEAAGRVGGEQMQHGSDENNSRDNDYCDRDDIDVVEVSRI